MIGDNEGRSCFVDGKVGHFLTWEEKLVGLVEFADGIRAVDPAKIEFSDRHHAMLCSAQKYYDARSGKTSAVTNGSDN